MSNIYMTNEKPYYSIELNEILRKYINKQKYGDFAILIEDILQRRAYEYEFSNDEMEEQAINLIKYLEEIKFVKGEEIGNIFGIYDENTILLNADYFVELAQKDFDKFANVLYETLSHETYHAIVDGEDEAGLYYYNDKNEEWEGTALDEIITETAADRTTISRDSKDAERYRTNTTGYNDITFATNMLAASLGTTEKEVLKNGIKKRTDFMQFFVSRFPNLDIAEYAKFEIFDKFELSLDVIYNLDYLDEEEQEADVVEQLFATSLTTLFESVYDLASFQIAYNFSVNPSSNYLAEITYRFQKLERLMKDALDKFQEEKYITLENRETIEIKIEKNRENLANKIYQISTVVKNSYKFENSEIYFQQFELAKKGMLSQNEEMLEEKYGIKICKDTLQALKSITANLEYTNYILKEDFDNGRVWDNKGAGIILKRILDKHIQSQQSNIENSSKEERQEDKSQCNEGLKIESEFDKKYRIDYEVYSQIPNVKVTKMKRDIEKDNKEYDEK